jgi:23S rRNA pseudouridine2605 synthase
MSTNQKTSEGKGVTKQRLSKVLAAAGVASRRACEELIFAKKITVNGTVVSEQVLVDPANDVISVDGVRLESAQDKVYYILN